MSCADSLLIRIAFAKAMRDWFEWLRPNEKILVYHSIRIVSFWQSWFLRQWLQRKKFSYALHDMRLEVRRLQIVAMRLSV